jgi:Putative zinc-finger
MSCRDWESRIALYVEGDLEEVEQSALEMHLRGCSACWDLAEDLRESQAMFKSIRQDVADEAMLSSLRSRVLTDIASREAGNWFERFLFGGMRRKAALAGIAMMIVGGTLWFSYRPAPRVDVPSQPEVVIPPPAVAAAPPKPVVPPPSPNKLPVRRHKPQPAPQREEPAPQVTIKLLTDDPNVIIYWLVDEKGE